MGYEPRLEDDIALGLDEEEDEGYQEPDEMWEDHFNDQEMTMQGACTGHEEPDLWFSDSSEQEGSGRIPHATSERLIKNALLALSICNRCPITKECLALGMQDENIDNGIWGGMLSGERIAKARTNIRANDRLNKISFARKVRERQFA